VGREPQSEVAEKFLWGAKSDLNSLLKSRIL